MFQLASLRVDRVGLLRDLGGLLEALALKLIVTLLKFFLLGPGLTQVLIDIVQVVLVLVDFFLEYTILKIGVFHICLQPFYVLLQVLDLAFELVSCLISICKLSVLLTVVVEFNSCRFKVALDLLKYTIVLSKALLHQYILSTQYFELLLLMFGHGSYDFEIFLERLIHILLIVVQFTYSGETVVVVLSVIFVILRHAHHFIVEVDHGCRPEGLGLGGASLGQLRRDSRLDLGEGL